MAATLITETDVIDVSSLSVLIYGPPGAWKTSLAQTAHDPITLDFDRGAHRSFNRKAVMRFDSWSDVGEAAPEIARRFTVVVDTIGRLLDLMSADIISENGKWGSRTGGLSLQGFGVLKARFAHWVGQLRLAGKDMVFIAHEKEEKEGDERFMRPDIQGGSYVEVMKFTDLVGYLKFDRGSRRILDFNPSDRHLGKNAAGWQALTVPSLAESRTFLADLLTDAKAKIGKTAAASAEAARRIEQFRLWLEQSPSLDALNDGLKDLAELHNGAKKQVWHMIRTHAETQGLSFDAKAKAFGPKTSAEALA